MDGNGNEQGGVRRFTDEQIKELEARRAAKAKTVQPFSQEQQREAMRLRIEKQGGIKQLVRPENTAGTSLQDQAAVFEQQMAKVDEVESDEAALSSEPAIQRELTPDEVARKLNDALLKRGTFGSPQRAGETSDAVGREKLDDATRIRQEKLANLRRVQDKNR